ncbi:MAG: MGMT family protein [Cyclobacteriaceae bacterium]|nr:MGMT family protein [Cyclobacteriaceae bacterium]
MNLILLYFPEFGAISFIWITVDKTSFFQDVYEVVNLIPEGRVTSYGAIAKYLGTTSSARMVGWALNGSFGADIPAHRVVNRNGLLTGKKHFGDHGRMKELLEQEGIKVSNDQVVDFEKIFWDPIKELF